MPMSMSNTVAASINSIPLLDASSLPSAEDWSLLESMNPDAASDFEPDFDRFGRVRLAAWYDE
jgi:hypothetical protein